MLTKFLFCVCCVEVFVCFWSFVVPHHFGQWFLDPSASIGLMSVVRESSSRNALKVFMKLPGGWIGWSFVDLWYWTFMSCCFCYPNDLLFCKYVKIIVIFSVISGCDYSLLSLSMPKRINVCKYVDGWSSDILSKFPWWP